MNYSRKNKKKKNQKKYNDAARYSGLAFEMLILILGGVFGGIKLDEKLGTKPLFILIGSVLGVVTAIYFAIKDSLKR